MRSPRAPAQAPYLGVALALISAALAPSAAAQALDPCAPRNENSEIIALLRASAAIATDRQADPRAAEICANRATAPQIIAVQAGAVVVATTGFAGAIMGRLDSVRGPAAVGEGAPTETASLATDGLMALGAGRKSRPPPGPASPVTVYAMGTFLGGSRADAPNLFGFDYDATSGTLGLEYSVSRNLIVGLAGNYAATNADIHNGATVDVSAVQAAAYLSYATRQWFVDALAAYGSHDLDLARPGIDGPVRSSTGAGAFALAARAGYLFDFGGLRAGPIAGLAYIRSRIDGYTEKGDSALALTVSALTIDSLTGSVGVRLLAPFRAGGNLVIPFLNVTLEHRFGDSDDVLAANLAQGPASPISLPFPAFDARDFGQVEGGVTVELGTDLSASISGASTFARDDGNDFRVGAGLNYRF